MAGWLSKQPEGIEDRGSSSVFVAQAEARDARCWEEMPARSDRKMSLRSAALPWRVLSEALSAAWLP